MVNLLVRQLIKFAIVGALTALIDFGCYLFLTRFFLFWQTHYLWANALSIFLSATVNFFWNRSWTFRDTKNQIFLKYFKFWVAVLVGLGLNQVIFYLLVRRGFYDIFAKAIAAIFVMFVRFFINKRWVFLS